MYRPVLDRLSLTRARAPGRWVPALALVALLSAGVPAGVRAAGEPAGDSPAPIDLVYAQRFAEVLTLAAEELTDPALPTARRLEILRATATVHLLRAEATADTIGRAAARDAMRAMLTVDPDADFTPGYRYPASVHALFHEVRRARSAGAPAVSALRVAVAPFFLIDLGGDTRFDWAAFAQALPFVVTTDLETIPQLVLLSREQMQAIEQELALATQDELVSAENRLRLRELLSAASFIYGEVQVLPGDEIWLEIRWVQTETGATLLARHGRKRIRRGRDLLELERAVVLEDFVPALLEGLGHAQAGLATERARAHFERKAAAGQRGQVYLEYVTQVARATLAEERGDWAAARDYWEAAAAQLPEQTAAHHRAQALALHMGVSAPAGGEER